jgi:hypothetical protein
MCGSGQSTRFLFFYFCFFSNSHHFTRFIRVSLRGNSIVKYTLAIITNTVTQRTEKSVDAGAHRLFTFFLYIIQRCCHFFKGLPDLFLRFAANKNQFSTRGISVMPTIFVNLWDCSKRMAIKGSTFYDKPRSLWDGSIDSCIYHAFV